MDKINYDYIIVGGGITGITLSWLLSKSEKKILLLDKNKQLGGINRFDTIENDIVLHTPQIYSDCYLSFIDLLNDMNLEFYKLFTRTNRNFLENINFSNYEKIVIFINLLYLTLNPNYGNNITMDIFLKKSDFSKNTYNKIENIINIIF